MKEKTLGLNVMEWRATTAEKVLELAKQKANEAEGMLGEIEVKLVETASNLSTQDKEFADYKVGRRPKSKPTTTRASRMLKTLLAPLSFRPGSSGLWEAGW